MANTFTFDDSGWKEAFRQYLDIKKNVDPGKELRRRAKNVAIRLIKSFGDNAPSREEIARAVRTLGWHVKIRPKIKEKTKAMAIKGKGRGGRRRAQIAMELRARQNARTFTATGWFPALEKLGGNPRRKKAVRGPERGRLDEKLTGLKIYELMTNAQPGAAQVVDRATGNILQAALDSERDDMIAYIERKLEEAARKAGLK